MTVANPERTNTARAERAAARYCVVPLEYEDHWTGILSQVPHAIAHSWAYCHALSKGSAPRIRLFVADTPAGPSICPFRERSFRGTRDILTPYGFSGFAGGDQAAALAAFRHFGEQGGYVCGYVGLNPLLSQHTDTPGCVRTGAAYRLNLRQPLGEIRANFSETIRQRLGKWEMDKVELVRDRVALKAGFLEIYPDFVRRVGASSVYDFSAETLAAWLSLDAVHLVGAARSGKIEAISVFGHTPHAGDYLFSAARPEGRGHAAGLLWHGICELKSAGIPELNLGGGVRDGDGLDQFKSWFGGERVSLQALQLVFDQARFDALCAEYGGSGAYFPPYHAPSGDEGPPA